MRRTLIAVTLAVAFAFTGAACSSEPSDSRPDSTEVAPRKIAGKHIDPRRCEKRKGTICKKWDDEDYIFTLQDGAQYDVDKSEYDSYNIGDRWPR